MNDPTVPGPPDWLAAELSPAATPAGADVPMAPLPASIGPFKILEVLGQGGMGVVYLAEQEQPIRRRVALKVIKLGMDSRSVLVRFEGERQALAMMEHENIAKVLEVGLADNGRPWFAMEYVPGQPITDFCDAHGLGLAERLELFRHVCAGVQHAHQKGIIHRDLKPANILVTRHEGRAVPKIIDFGLARAIDHRLVEASMYTEQGQVLGTPEYMSPEQACTGNQDIDTRTDVYSLGVVLFELLVGDLPVPRERLRRGGLLEIQRMIREVEPPRPSSRLGMLEAADPTAGRVAGAPDRLRWRQPLRGDIDWIVLRALEKDPERRYQTALAFADDLGRHLRNEPVAARPPTLQYRLAKFVRKHRVPVAAAALVLATVIAGVAVSLHMLFAARVARDDARQLAATSQQQLARMQMMAIDQAAFWTARSFEQAKVPSLADVFGKQVDGAPVLSGLSMPPLDPWGGRYRLEPRGNRGDWAVCSDGPDRRRGGADDLEVHDRMFTVETQKRMAELFAQRAGRLIAMAQEVNLREPATADLAPFDAADTVDPWGNLLIPHPFGDRLVVRSPGPDGAPQTDDDLVHSEDLMPLTVEPEHVRSKIGQCRRIMCIVRLRHLGAAEVARSLVGVLHNLGSAVRGLTINPVGPAAVGLWGAPEQVVILLEHVRQLDRSE
ncbi:MAG: protein kinase [Planctomycetes bacterium]|jgi:serine/threonine protein kinase|nr:protein kinase [Planctomycetota bacterium]